MSPDAHGQEGRWHFAALWILLLSSVCALWLPGLGTSLNVDETVTFWVINTGVRDILHRSIHFQFSPIAFFVPWLFTTILGSAETVLRLPSLASMAAALLLLHRLGRRLLDREAGLVAAIVLSTCRVVAQEAFDARPYALGLMIVIAAMLFLVRWLDRGRTADAAAYAVLASLTVYVHPLLGTMFAVHALWILHQGRQDRPPPWPTLWWVVALIFGLLLPLVPQALSLLRRSSQLTYAPDPSYLDLFEILATPFTVGLFLIGLLLAFLGGASIARTAEDRSPTLPALALTWLVVPPVVLFVVSRSSPAKVLTPHYAIGSTPALALLVAGVIRGLRPAWCRLVVAATIVVLSIVCFSREFGSPQEDWRSAAEAVRPLASEATPVLVFSGLIESAHREWLLDPEKAGYLLAPFSYYRIQGPLLPGPLHTATAELASYWDGLVSGRLLPSSRFVLVTRGDGRGIEASLSGALEPAGFRARRLGPFRGVFVSVFERDPR